MRTSSVLLALLTVVAHPRANAADGSPPLADPTRPPASARTDAERPARQPLEVSAVFLRGNRALALVNGRLLGAGERLGSIKIEAVLPDGIRYRTAGDGRLLTQLVGGRPVLLVKSPPSTPLPARDSTLASTGAQAQ